MTNDSFIDNEAYMSIISAMGMYEELKTSLHPNNEVQ